jgi:hypothetical protein
MKVFLKFICVLFALQVQISFSQELTQKNDRQLNLPPGLTLYHKTNVNIDYSYKLNETPDFNRVDKTVRDFKQTLDDKEYETLEKSSPDVYTYYKEINRYFNSLSPKVKALYTADEIWYIYMFDQELKEKLTTIK